jgi:predicted nuclease of predicted toxin-antitoxin system
MSEEQRRPRTYELPSRPKHDARLILWLIEHGHTARRIGREYPAGLPDEQVLAIAEREGCILITDDRDFGELVFRHRQPHTGIIYLRLASYSLDLIKARLEHVLTHYADRLDRFLVVTPGDVRERRE